MTAFTDTLPDKEHFTGLLPRYSDSSKVRALVEPTTTRSERSILARESPI